MSAPDSDMVGAGQPSRQPVDRLTPLYTGITLAFLLLVVFGRDLDRIFDLYLFLVPLLLLPGLLLLVVLVGALIRNVRQRRWRRVVSVVLAPALAAAPLVLAAQFGITPTWLRFQSAKPSYEREIAAVERQPGVPLLRVLDWGETGGATGPNLLFTLVYDESDELALPADKRSEMWKERAKPLWRLNAIVKDLGRTSIQPLGHHFYHVVEAL